MAQNNLGGCYRVGLGVKKDDLEAMKWYQKAADQGVAEAQCYLGIYYGMGQGVPKDNVKALMWLTIADKSGSKEATGYGRTVVKEMTKEEIVQALDMAMHWKPKKSTTDR